MARGRVLVASILVAALSAPAGADPRPGTIIVIPGGASPAVPYRYPYGYPYAQALACWSDVRLFNTLRSGNFPYCRRYLRYRPGALECLQITEQVCEVVLPGSFLPIQTTSPVVKQVIPCPDGPEPPVCRRLDID